MYQSRSGYVYLFIHWIQFLRTGIQNWSCDVELLARKLWHQIEESLWVLKMMILPFMQRYKLERKRFFKECLILKSFLSFYLSDPAQPSNLQMATPPPPLGNNGVKHLEMQLFHKEKFTKNWSWGHTSYWIRVIITNLFLFLFRK